MAHFVNKPKGERISGRTVDVLMGQPVQIGLYGFNESPEGDGPDLTLMTYPVVRWNSIRDEAVASTRAVWDWIKLRAKPKAGTRRGVIPDAILNAAIAARRKWGVPI